MEGVLASTGVAYLAHSPADRVRLAPRDACQPRLSEAIVEAPSAALDATLSLARRVYRGFERHVSAGCRRLRGSSCPTGCVGACGRKLLYACASDDPRMPEAVHRYLRLGFDQGPDLRTLLTDARVVAVDELTRAALGECEKMRKFVRFAQLRDGSLAATFRPSADVVPLMLGHFASRMPSERFCIVDPIHRVALFHEPGTLRGRRACATVRLDRDGVEELLDGRELSDDEPYVEAMWQRFYESLELPGRDASQRGYDLRASLMPKRLWAGLTELDPRLRVTATVAPARYAGSQAPLPESSQR